ncbi:transporter [Rhodoferax lacus]|uniref:Transporter n=1 Tax=Rhodoferax lacus TaxID=2184758 RepID=A0A3E1RBI7_9BURK|nr:TolC family protein [Rhodoferax lacus]RFO96725.1 transporter [Rhodoferax lacus]
MKALALGLAIALGTGAALAQEAAELPGASVESLLAVARANNPEVAGMRFEATAAQERIAQAEALPDPRFKLELLDITRMGEQNPTLWPSDVGSTRYTFSQELPWFGTQSLKREQAAYTAQGAQTQVQSVWADVAARIKLAYAQLYFLQRNAALNQEVLDLMQRLEQIARARYAGGLAPQQDTIRAQAEQSAMQGELIAVQTDVHHTRARINALLARPIHAELAAPQSLRPLPAADQLDFDALVQRALAHNQQLAADEARVQAADKGQALAQKGRYPSFTLGVAPTQFQNDFKAWDLMLEMNIPLQQGTRRAQEREALAMLEAARARRDATANQLQADLSENLDALQSAQQTEKLMRHKLLPQAELSLQSALSGYEAGKQDFAGVLDAQRQIRQAKASLIKAQAEGQARLAQLERLLGEEP